VLGAYTAVGSGTVTADSSGAALIVTAPGGGDPSVEAALFPIPSGTSWDLTLGFALVAGANDSYTTCGAAITDGTSTAAHLVGAAIGLFSGQRYIESYSSLTTVVSHLANRDSLGGAAMTRGALFWARINRAGTTYTFFEGSTNGDWGQPVFQTTALGFTPTNYGAFCDSRSTTPVSIVVRHLSGS
jgi:hypothetical protein